MTALRMADVTLFDQELYELDRVALIVSVSSILPILRLPAQWDGDSRHVAHGGIVPWLVAIARINAVELFEQRRPAAGFAVESAPDLSGCLLHQIWREPDELASGGHCGDLRLATLFHV